MAKCKPFGHITHIIGFIEMFCLNYFDLVTGNPTVCAVLQLLYFLFKTILHMDFTPFCNCVQICTLDHGVVLCVHTLFYFKYSPSQYDLPVQSSLLSYGGLLWRLKYNAALGLVREVSSCVQNDNNQQGTMTPRLFLFFGFVTENKILSFNIIIVIIYVGEHLPSF